MLKGAALGLAYMAPAVAALLAVEVVVLWWGAP